MNQSINTDSKNSKEPQYYLGSEQQCVDPTARMRRLIRAFVVRIGHK